jgi:hypothetical protein
MRECNVDQPRNLAKSVTRRFNKIHTKKKKQDVNLAFFLFKYLKLNFYDKCIFFTNFICMHSILMNLN